MTPFGGPFPSGPLVRTGAGADALYIPLLPSMVLKHVSARNLTAGWGRIQIHIVEPNAVATDPGLVCVRSVVQGPLTEDVVWDGELILRDFVWLRVYFPDATAGDSLRVSTGVSSA